MSKFVLVSELALDLTFSRGAFDTDSMLPTEGNGIYRVSIDKDIVAYRAASEPDNAVMAYLELDCLRRLATVGGTASEIWRRVARVIKGLHSPPIHLPRHWLEYHHKNLLSFFALPREVASLRWVAEISSEFRWVRFGHLALTQEEMNLESFVPSPWPAEAASMYSRFFSKPILDRGPNEFTAIAHEYDLQAIGSGSVVEGRTYEEWIPFLSDSQKSVLAHQILDSVRILGPAGSGKTLALCMRAMQISRDSNVEAQGLRSLIATHSWAMAERIDGILKTLNGGILPEKITVFPLLSLLDLHAGYIGNQRASVIGDDSTSGRFKTIEIIAAAIAKIDIARHPQVSGQIRAALQAAKDSRQRLELTLDLYSEISGVLSASGVATDDDESIREYLGAKREDWMPPFRTVYDLTFVIEVYTSFMGELVDRSSITTDQFILDAIRMLETFTWRMRKATEGYDFILVDELQIFDPQERTALQLLGRSRRGVPFITAEDPAQGVFSSLNSQRVINQKNPVYLEVVHRFNVQIFEFINFIYRRFPLNALPLRIHNNRSAGEKRPTIHRFDSNEGAVSAAVAKVMSLSEACDISDRICIVTLGDVDEQISALLASLGERVVRLESFDDVERLAYSRRSIVVSPWQFIGGTQFSHVIVVSAGISRPSSEFGRLSEMVSVYLSCSRATKSLSIFCGEYLPSVLSDAVREGLLEGE